MHSNLAKLFLCFAIYAIATIAIAEDSITRQNISLSQFRLEQRIQQISNEIPIVNESIVSTKSAINDFDAAAQRLEAIEYDFSSARDSIRQLHVLLKKWDTLKEGQIIPKSDLHKYRRYSSSIVDDLYQLSESELVEIKNYYFPSPYRRSGGDYSYLKPFEIALRQSGGIELNFFESIFSEIPVYEELEVVRNNFNSDLDDVADTEINKIRSYLPSLIETLSEKNEPLIKASIEEAFSRLKNQGVASLKRVSDSLKAHNAKLEQKKIALETQLSEFDVEYQKYLDKASKSKQLTGSYESWSVNFMIGGIILILMVLLLMSRGNKEIAEKLIERRTLVEILSMGFLLLAVIILGTSDKIQAEILGTLLGTIAGYVFGKQMAERDSQASNPNK